ncbi:MAG: DUF547 domain-containing protein [Candidatus Eisenbacteria bacterium]
MTHRTATLSCFAGFALAVATASALVVPARAAEPPIYSQAPAKGATAHLHDAWDEILRAHVADGRVDYVGLAGKDLAKLDRYLSRLAAVQADTLPGPDRIAFWINQYNATLVRVACARWHDGWGPDENNFELFRAPIVQTPDGAMPLDALQHVVLMRRLPDVRVNAALCKGAVGFPRLRSGAYHGADVDSLLEDDMRAFVADPARNRFDDSRRVATLSPVFELVMRTNGEDEFRAWLEAYAGRKLAGWTLEFAEWDWRVNAKGAPEPRLVPAKPAAAPAAPAPATPAPSAKPKRR